MQTKRILIPVDLDDVKSSLDALHFVEGMAKEFSVEATLLNVIHVNVAVLDRRLEDELRAERKKQLHDLARVWLSQCARLSFRVRTGCPYEEILAETISSRCELIILTPPKRSRSPFRSRTAERVVREAPCFTLVLPRAWKIALEQYHEVTRPSRNKPARALAVESPFTVGSADSVYQ